MLDEWEVVCVLRFRQIGDRLSASDVMPGVFWAQQTVTVSLLWNSNEALNQWFSTAGPRRFFAGPQNSLGFLTYLQITENV